MHAFTSQAAALAKLLRRERVLAVYHRDTDGTTSAALLAKFFPLECLSLTSPSLDQEAMRAIAAAHPDTIVFLDLAIDQEAQKIRELEKAAPIAVIDHHLFDHDLASARTLYINPRLEKKSAYLSASYVVFHLLHAMGKPVQKHAWIAGVGIIGDYAFREGKDVLDLLPKTLVGAEPFAGPLAEGSKLINSAIIAAGERGARKAYRSLVKAASFASFSKDPELQKWKRLVDREVEKVVASFEQEREHHPAKKLSILELKTALPIGSTVSTLISTTHPDLILVVTRKEAAGTKVSLRNQSGRVNLGDLAREASQGIGRGGGHERAAAAFVTDWETFRARLLKALPQV
ncbi:MAG: DHH family phosphoesterase [Candidatus Aenigmarchaeota archaeon]|nr:DHH family phosphoesterase [Candidatus Aenigmarchaeota archaeon]